jgi:hypothetical protein
VANFLPFSMLNKKFVSPPRDIFTPTEVLLDQVDKGGFDTVSWIH